MILTRTLLICSCRNAHTNLACPIVVAVHYRTLKIEEYKKRWILMSFQVDFYMIRKHEFYKIRLWIEHISFK
jgi:hypothetical protein